MEDTPKAVTLRLASGTEAAAALIIGLASREAIALQSWTSIGLSAAVPTLRTVTKRLPA